MIERRTNSVLIEFRGAGTSPRATGHAAIWDTQTTIGDLRHGGFREEIAPGAFTRAIARDDVLALYNHDPNMVLGRTSAGTLTLAEDDRGLYFDVSLPETSFARDLAVSMARGDVRGASFGFTVEADSWSLADDGTEVRTIKEVGRLYDVSPVAMPAYPGTDSQIRSEVEIGRRTNTLAQNRHADNLARFNALILP